MKTFSSASFNTQSNTNLNQLGQQNHESSKNHLSPPPTNRSMSVPNANHNIQPLNKSELKKLQIGFKNDKNKKTNVESHGPGKLEFVKVDVDNNMVSCD